jgi:hypothetical protein
VRRCLEHYRNQGKVRSELVHRHLLRWALT